MTAVTQTFREVSKIKTQMHINIKRYNTEQQQALESFATTALLC